MVELLFKRKSTGKLGSLVLDATLKESQSFRNEVTSFPIESGGSISDHIIRAPEEFSIEGFVTNTPINFLDENGFFAGSVNPYLDAAALAGQAIVGKEDRVLNAYLALLDLAGYPYPDSVFKRTGKVDVELVKQAQQTTQNRGVKQLVTLITNYRNYKDMVLTSLDIPTDVDTGDSVKFSASFRKVTFVELQTVPRLPEKVSEKKTGAKNAKKSASDTKNNGQAPVTTKKPPQSILAKAVPK